MEELGLPERLFETGYEPTGRKRINNYFNLRWIEVVKSALSDSQQEMLAESQFRQIMLMGSHTFSVMFAHQLLSRQLVTKKLYELWWLFAGKPIRYGIGDFGLVTGLNCGALPMTSGGGQGMGIGKKKRKSKAKQPGGDGVVWQSLFGSEDTITPEWILCRLSQKEKYKDEETRLRLSLLLLVEGILCPTSGSTQIRPLVVEMLADIGMFLKYPWGRESFLLTVASGKIRSAVQLAQETLAIQGFSHAMVLVTVCSCPQIIAEPRLGEDLVNDDLPIEDIVDAVCSRSVKINVVTVQTLELIGQVTVRSILYEGSNIDLFPDEVVDLQVSHMVTLIREDFPFEINTWRGGVRAIDAKQSKSGYGAEGVGAEHDQTSVSDGTARGFGHGFTLDVPNVVRCLADELQSRADPLLDILKNHITREIVALKEEVIRQNMMTAHSANHEPSGGYAGISKGLPTKRTHATNLTDPSMQSAEGPPVQTSIEPQVVEKDVTTHAISDVVPSEFVVTVPSPGENRGVSRGHTDAPIPNSGCLVDSAKQSHSLRGSHNEEGETDGTECTPIAVSDGNLEERPPADEATTKPASTAADSVMEDSDATHMDVDYEARSSPTTGGASTVHSLSSENVEDRPQADEITAKPAATAPSTVLADIPAGVTSFKHATDEAETAANSRPSEVGEKRVSKRLRTQAVRYSPPAPLPKQVKGGGKKTGGARNKKSASVVQQIPDVATSSTISPTKLSPTFVEPTIVGPLVGGFSPCVRLNAFRLAGFNTVMHTQRDYNLGEGVIVANAVFKALFESSQPQPSKAADMVVTFIRKRLRQEGVMSYDFLPASFVDALRGEYQQFSRVQDIGKFSFSSIFGDPCFPNMRWAGNVQVLYCPFQVDGRHWIGVVIDISDWHIHVLDCNRACLQDAKLEALLKPFCVLMPLLIRHNGEKALNEAVMESPMAITRLDLPFCCEQTGLSCVATHILMELHATNNLSQVANLTEESLSVAAQTYAIEAFAAFSPEHLKEFPNA